LKFCIFLAIFIREIKPLSFKNLNPQILLTRFFMERFLERVSLSKYKRNFILKGGILISAIVGIEARATRDIDIKIKSLPLNGQFYKILLAHLFK